MLRSSDATIEIATPICILIISIKIYTQQCIIQTTKTSIIVANFIKFMNYDAELPQWQIAISIVYISHDVLLHSVVAEAFCAPVML